MTLYVPEPVYQLDGSPCQGSSCWAAVGAWQMDGQSEGEQTPTPTRLRNMAGSPECGGGNVHDIQRAFMRQGRSYAVRLFEGPELRSILAQEDRRLVAVPVDYKAWPDDKKCDDPSFRGYHMMGIIPGLLRNGQVRVMNPLCSVSGASREARYQKVKLDDVMLAARAVAKEMEPAGTIRVGVVWRPKQANAPDLPGDTPAAATSDELLRTRNGELEEALRAVYETVESVLHG